MSRLIFVLVVLCAQAQPLAAQSRNFECTGAKDMSAAQRAIVAEKLQQAYRNVQSLRADFLQDSYLAALDMQEQSTGTMVFDKPGKMRWEYQRPEPQLFIIREQEVLLHQPQEKQLLIDSAEQMLLSDLPLSFLMGVGKLSEDFKVQRACETTEGIVLWLEPKREQQAVERGLAQLRLLVSPKDFLPVGGYVVDRSGNITAILLQRLKVNSGVLSSEFQFVAPPGTDVVDRRATAEKAE